MWNRKTGRKIKMGKAWEHSSHEWMRGRHRGEGPIFKYMRTKLENSRQVPSIMLRSGVRKCNKAPEQMILCVVLAVGPLPPYVHLASTRRHSCDECYHAFPIFRWSSPVYYCEHKPKVKAWEAWEWSYRLVSYTSMLNDNKCAHYAQAIGISQCCTHPFRVCWTSWPLISRLAMGTMAATTMVKEEWRCISMEHLEQSVMWAGTNWMPK